MAQEPINSSGYEQSDVRPRGVILLGVGLIVLAAIVLAGLWWMFDVMEASAKRADPRVSPLLGEAERAPGPELEFKLRYTDFEAADQQRLEEYGWADRQQKVVHIPIQRAMQLLAERGLPEPNDPVQEQKPEEPKAEEQRSQQPAPAPEANQ